MAYVQLVRNQAAERRASAEKLTERREKLLSDVRQAQAKPRGQGYAARSSRTLTLRAEKGIPTDSKRTAGPSTPELAERPNPTTSGVAGTTRLSRYKEMESTAARLVTELERSDREWRQCVSKLEARLKAVERENANLRHALKLSEQRTMELANVRLEPGHEAQGDPASSSRSRRAPQAPSSRPSTPAYRDEAGLACRESEWSAYHTLNERAAQVRNVEVWSSAELAAAGRQALEEPPMRLRRRSELFAAKGSCHK